MKRLSYLMMVFACAMCCLSSCEKDEEESNMSMYIYGVGSTVEEYDIQIIARGGFDENSSQALFNQSGRGVGHCGNMPNDIRGKFINDSRVFSIDNLPANWMYTIRVTSKAGSKLISVENSRHVWIVVNE